MDDEDIERLDRAYRQLNSRLDLMRRDLRHTRRAIQFTADALGLRVPSDLRITTASSEVDVITRIDDLAEWLNALEERVLTPWYVRLWRGVCRAD